MSAVVVRVRRRDVAWAVALILVVTALWAAGSDEADAGFVPPGDGIDVVYVAVSTNFPDSLGVGPGAGALAAPIIILPTNPPIPTASVDELKRLDPKRVVIVGGTAVISNAMKSALESLLPNATVTRIGGADRFETNAMFSEATFPVEGWASIAAPAFTAVNPADANVSSGTSVSNSSGGSLYASIQLPHGAKILELKAIGSDPSAVADLDVNLGRASETSSSEFATATSSGSSGDTSFSTTAIPAGSEIVDNETFAYFVRVGTTTSGRQIYGVMVRYQLGASGA